MKQQIENESELSKHMFCKQHPLFFFTTTIFKTKINSQAPELGFSVEQNSK
jgi:hypothetical protein